MFIISKALQKKLTQLVPEEDSSIYSISLTTSPQNRSPHPTTKYQKLFKSLNAFRLRYRIIACNTDLAGLRTLP